MEKEFIRVHTVRALAIKKKKKPMKESKVCMKLMVIKLVC